MVAFGVFDVEGPDFEVFFGGFSLFPPLPLHAPSAYLAIKDHIVAWSDCEVEHLC